MSDAESLEQLIATGRAKWARSVKTGSLADGPTETGPAPAPAADALAHPAPGSEEEHLWSFGGLAGQLVEVCGDQVGLTSAAHIVLDAQRRGEPGAWIAVGPSLVFPPDLADHGIDLEALPIVRVQAIEQAWKAVDELLRPGGFGLCVIDEVETADPARTPAASPAHSRSRSQTTPLSVQVRLAALARHHRAIILWLRSTRRSQQDPISQAGLRVAASRSRQRHARSTETSDSGAGSPSRGTSGAGRFRCELRILRSKRMSSPRAGRSTITFDRDGSVGIA